ncbi:hypothetical protein FZEAL_10274, partial [Fusarium zealandicum]
MQVCGRCKTPTADCICPKDRVHASCRDLSDGHARSIPRACITKAAIDKQGKCFDYGKQPLRRRLGRQVASSRSLDLSSRQPPLKLANSTSKALSASPTSPYHPPDLHLEHLDLFSPTLPAAQSTPGMCVTNNAERICGQTYAHLAQDRSRMTWGAQCKRVILSHIIKNRLTPVATRKNFEKLMRALYLTQHGPDIERCMRSRVERCVVGRIRGMVHGGLINESVHPNRHTEYVWRADADNFLGVDGWCDDWSVAHGESLRALNLRVPAELNLPDQGDDPAEAPIPGVARRDGRKRPCMRPIQVNSNIIMGGNNNKNGSGAGKILSMPMVFFNNKNFRNFTNDADDSAVGSTLAEDSSDDDDD